MKRILSIVLLCALLFSSVFPQFVAAESAPVSSAEETPTAETKAAETWDIDGDGTLEILAIGNSFSVDALQYVWNICRSLGISKIVLGNLYIGGCSIATHVTNITGDSAAYTYYYNDSGTWTNTKNYKISTAVKSRSWDFISMQQASGDSGVESSYSKLGTLISNVKSLMGSSAKTKLVWHMTWAYQGDSTHSAFSTYNKNQTTMYNAIVTAVTNKILTNSNFDRIIPCGTAVQNMRSSVVGDTLTRDGYHMSYDLGRFLVGLMFVKSITGMDVTKNTYIPSGVSDTNAYIAANAVTKAYSTPLKVTKSVYTGKNPSSGYIELVPTMNKGAYWHSTATNYNKLVTSSNINQRYWATHRFVKDELPVGTIILIKSGWQYRPEGWVTDAKQTSREDVTSDQIVVVTDNWWKNYTLRAFNISKTDNSDLTSMTASEVLTYFRIFVPESIYLKNHVQLKPDLHKGAYWNPTKSGSFNVPITTASNSPNFFCTPRFTKAQLPVGSVIIVKSSYQYRPDGWVKDELQTGTRASVVTRYSTIISSSWWGSYTIRGFNISLTSGDAITGKTQNDIYKNFKIYVPKSSHTHTAASSTTVTAPTCTAQGYTTYTCTMCKASYTGAQTAALGHTLTSVITAPTCIADGFTTYTCTRCKQVTTGDTVPALGHTLVSNVTAPSCTVDGYTTYTCTTCNEVSTGDLVPALGHSLKSYITPPTCTQDGYTTYVCTVCNETSTADIVPARGHNIQTVVTPPTCTHEGYTTHTCTQCDLKTVSDIIPSLEHDYDGAIFEPSCTENGYTLYTCVHCGHMIIGNETLALGHDPKYQTFDRDTHTVSCSRCDYGFTEAHSFADGNCICGEPEIAEAILSSLKMGHTLDLASDISVKIIVPKTQLEGYDMSTVYLTAELENYAVNTREEDTSVTIYPVLQGNYYYFVIEGLTAVRMSDRIRSVLYGVKDGQAYYSPTDDYSIADYAYSQLGKANIPQSLKVLCADLLRYGSAAQIYKNYHTEALADQLMTEEYRTYLTDISNMTLSGTNKVLDDMEAPAFNWIGKALELNSKVGLKFVFDRVSYSGNVVDLELEVSYIDHLNEMRTLRISNAEPYGNTAGRYAFSFDGLLAAELRTVVSVRICVGETYLSRTLQYSADTYGANKTGNIGNLCKALFAYSDSAKAYFPGN